MTLIAIITRTHPSVLAISVGLEVIQTRVSVIVISI